jgi:1,4-alpha-glucan branching enzyme
VQSLVRDLNQLYRQQPALHQRDCEAHGFEWLVSDDAEQSVLAWMRYGDAGRPVMVVCNFTPVPRHGYCIGVPDTLQRWREILNTDSQHYGGSNLGNGTDTLQVEPVAAQGRSHSLSLTLPPLATLFLQAT